MLYLHPQIQQENYSFLGVHLSSIKIWIETWENYKNTKEPNFLKITITIYILIDMCKAIYTMSMED